MNLAKIDLRRHKDSNAPLNIIDNENIILLRYDGKMLKDFLNFLRIRVNTSQDI